MEGYDVDISKFPSVKIPRFMSPVGLQVQQVGDNSVRNMTRKLTAATNQHTETNNFAPNESERLSISPVLLFTKDQNTKGNNNGDCNGKEIKAVKVNCVNYGGNMDRGVMTFTSDVSLPKYDKQLCWVKK